MSETDPLSDSRLRRLGFNAAERRLIRQNRQLALMYLLVSNADAVAAQVQQASDVFKQSLAILHGTESQQTPHAG